MTGQFPIEHILLGAAILLLLSIIASKASGRLGVPALALFLIIGMLAGSDGPGGIYFDDPSNRTGGQRCPYSRKSLPIPRFSILKAG